MSEKKNPTAIQIGQRIKQARRMAGFQTAADLLKHIPEWSNSRLGNYEAGISLPSPDHIKLIADVTDVSPCWLMFALGPIRSSDRDLQAIRHQNFTHIISTLKSESGSSTRFYKETGLSRKKSDDYLNNPFLAIPMKVVRLCERFLDKPVGWMDEQHVETDPLCASFPDDMRELMEIYSNLEFKDRELLLRMARVVEA